MKKDQKLFESGKFFLGCNWWASHAGTNMWHYWRADVVESDVKKISEAGISVMRVFPLWSDFQPLKMHYAARNDRRELRLGEDPLPHTEEGRAGIDPIMIERFAFLCDVAEKYNVKLIVGLVTGWMSGRMHVPPAFEGSDLIRDPLTLSWEIRFVKYMVRRFKDRSAIAAWDLGNECNVMAYRDTTREQAYIWLSSITNAIRSEDNTRPVISGMHGTLAEEKCVWNAEDLGEILDVLCTHPYPIFTPHCNTDPINEMKSILHSTAESLMYAGTSEKPCFIEEIGTLGPMIASEEIAGDYIRAASFSAWAHDLRGFVWWCANEQNHLTHTPYDWNSVERELGFFHADGSPKPVLNAMSDMSAFVDSFKYGSLPERIRDAVCILTCDQDTWACAYGSFILAKQAGLDLDFVYHNEKIPLADVYMLPSLCKDKSLSLHSYRELLSRVNEGATLYISLDTALLSEFESVTGLRALTRCQNASCEEADICGEPLRFESPYKIVFEVIGAKVLLTSKDGAPIVTEYSYGKGRVCLVTAPIEKNAGVGAGLSALPYYKIYEMLGLRSSEKAATSDTPTVCLTEHILSDSKRILTLTNYRPISQRVSVKLKDGYSLIETLDVQDKTPVESFTGGFIANVKKNTGFVAIIEK